MRGSILVLGALAACGGSSSHGYDGNDALPCDVRAVLADACTTCHTDPPNSASKVAIASRADVFAPSASADADDVRTVMARRLHDDANPMPPRTEVPLSAGQLAILDAWLVVGTPAGTGANRCDPIPPPPAATTCASGSTWTMGTTANADMTPGRACKACHQAMGPRANYAFQGTVFDAFHTADDCNSIPPAGAKIEILDEHDAVVRTLIPGLSGNFTSFEADDPAQPPYRARLVVGTLVREMKSLQTSTDCNGCHTEQGTNAFATTRPNDPAPPGRITWPTMRP